MENLLEIESALDGSHATLQLLVSGSCVEVRILSDDHTYHHIPVFTDQLVQALERIGFSEPAPRKGKRRVIPIRKPQLVTPKGPDTA